MVKNGVLLHWQGADHLSAPTTSAADVRGIALCNKQSDATPYR